MVVAPAELVSVQTFNGRSGDVLLSSDDIVAAGGALMGGAPDQRVYGVVERLIALDARIVALVPSLGNQTGAGLYYLLSVVAQRNFGWSVEE